MSSKPTTDEETILGSAAAANDSWTAAAAAEIDRWMATSIGSWTAAKRMDRWTAAGATAVYRWTASTAAAIDGYNRLMAVDDLEG